MDFLKKSANRLEIYYSQSWIKIELFKIKSYIIKYFYIRIFQKVEELGHMRMLINKIRDKLTQGRSLYTSLILIFILALSLRCLMPFYLLMTHDSYKRLMISSSYAHDMLAMSISLAKGEGLHLEYRSYVANIFKISSPELEEIQKSPTTRPFFLDKGGIGQVLIAGGITYVMNSLNAPIIQIFQGIVDSIGCLLVYGILTFYFTRRICILGALIYSIWPPSIFYSYHFMGEAYIPFFMLAIGYTIILALNREKWFWFALAGSLIGLSFRFRSDNALILPIYIAYILWFYRQKISFALGMATLVLILCILSFMPLKMIMPENSKDVPTIGAALYNSLGEYPGNYKGLRFFNDETAAKHGIKKANEYLEGDNIFKLMYSISQHDLFLGVFEPMTSHHLILLAYIREVIIEKPFLYANRLISRFVAYLPSNPFIACITYFFKNPRGTRSMRGYRYSQLFQLVKYIDYFFFLVFLYGVWLCRRHRKMLSLLCIYTGVLASHVILGCGEVYFRDDMEYAYFDPRYLLGMVSIWPVFIAAAVGKIAKI